MRMRAFSASYFAFIFRSKSHVGMHMRAQRAAPLFEFPSRGKEGDHTSAGLDAHPPGDSNGINPEPCEFLRVY